MNSERVGGCASARATECGEHKCCVDLPRMLVCVHAVVDRFAGDKEFEVTPAIAVRVPSVVNVKPEKSVSQSRESGVGLFLKEWCRGVPLDSVHHKLCRGGFLVPGEAGRKVRMQKWRGVWVRVHMSIWPPHRGFSS